MAEYEFIEGEIVELATNLVALTIRLEVLIGHRKCRATISTVIIFKNFTAIILSVMQICSLTPPAQALKDQK